MGPRVIDIPTIRIDGGTQSRASLYQNVVDDYASAMGDGTSFPPVVVFYDGTDHWLADGFHRYHAHVKLGLAEIDADVRQGTRRDAILYSVGANESHGLRRTNEDKRRAVLTLLNDAEWAKWSDREIAKVCAVSHVFVGRLRPVDTGNVTSMRRTFVHPKTGDETVMNFSRFDPHQAREHLDAAKVIRADKVEAKRAEKIAHTEVIAANNAALPVGERKYSVIYADPPWSFDVWSGAGKDRAAENHYPTMTQAQIEALPVEAMAADDCALFMWAVMPQLPEALAVIKAWGFEYKTCAFVWVKQTKDEERFATGMGYWTRANAEICLLATRGSPARLNADVHQVIASPRMEHSRKPDDAAERIMRLVPGPYLEMFARSPREGWDVWGNQAEAAA